MDYLKVCSDFALPLATVFFAYQQARISKLKRKDDLYDKDIEFMESLGNLLNRLQIKREILSYIENF